MKYTEVSFSINPLDLVRDLLVYALGDEGPYDSFSSTAEGLLAYVPSADYDAAFLDAVLDDIRSQFPLACIDCSVSEMPDVDWNEEWERQHSPVMVEGRRRVWVRAPFHEHRTDADFEIEIEPKMSFGTAHHPTTYMMLSLLADLPVAGKRVLDMGCGTAVLGIMAAKAGAAQVLGVDIDEWAYDNAMENVARNKVVMDIRIGDAALLADSGPFDVVLANINRNILLRDMAAYAAVLSQGGLLLLSGFYDNDVPSLVEAAGRLQLALVEHRSREDWAALALSKTVWLPFAKQCV